MSTGYNHGEANWRAARSDLPHQSISFLFSLILLRRAAWWVNGQVLRLGQNAEPEAIKASFRRLSRCVHPDKNETPRALAAMQRVSTAYAGLMASQASAVSAVR